MKNYIKNNPFLSFAIIAMWILFLGISIATIITTVLFAIYKPKVSVILFLSTILFSCYV